MTQKQKTTSKPQEKFYGLKLNLGNAPVGVGHQLVGLDGEYYTDKVTPVGGPMEAPLAAAKQYAENPGAAVQLVELTEEEITKARVEYQEKLKAAQNRNNQTLQLVRG